MADLNSIYCPKCRCHTNLIYRAGYERSITGGKYLYHAVEECNNCQQHFLTIRLNGQDKNIADDRHHGRRSGRCHAQSANLGGMTGIKTYIRLFGQRAVQITGNDDICDR